MEVDSTLGFIEIGVLVSGILFGIFTMQVYIYHRNFSEDPGWIKYGLVDGMCVSHYGDPTVFLVYPIPFVAVTLFDALIATLAQGYFTYRIAKLTGPPYVVPILCCILMLLYTICKKAGAMPLIETGIVTSCDGHGHGGLVVSPFYRDVTVAFYVILPKVFSNAMLANLNSRMRFRDMQTTVVTEMATIQFPGTTAQPSELQMDLPAITSAPSESKIEEGPQFEVKALPLSLA
ncbi:hypothetical protein F5879DRAFT_1020839 [Lentinula edodes]|nr:hypothetical protein F5879DRAFT_1020839 [Lentinula edodes]